MRMSVALSTPDEEGEPLQQNIAAAVSKITEGLRGDAVDMAMDIGKDTLLTSKGIDQLISTIRSSIFPIEGQEAKVLRQIGQRPRGPMSRQSGGSMVSYISRRKRGWTFARNLIQNSS